MKSGEALRAVSAEDIEVSWSLLSSPFACLNSTFLFIAQTLAKEINLEKEKEKEKAGEPRD